jgi:hypothetical protein
VVFLQFDMSQRVYLFTNGPFSAFRVQNGRVQPVTQRAARAPTTAMPKDVTSFIDEFGSVVTVKREVSSWWFR